MFKNPKNSLPVKKKPLKYILLSVELPGEI